MNKIRDLKGIEAINGIAIGKVKEGEPQSKTRNAGIEVHHISQVTYNTLEYTVSTRWHSPAAALPGTGTYVLNAFCEQENRSVPTPQPIQSPAVF